MEALQDIDGDGSSERASSSSSESRPRSASQSSVDGDGETEYEPPAVIDGVPVARESRKNHADDGLRVLCPRHASCRCYKSLRKTSKEFGERHAEFFFGLLAFQGK